MNIPDSEPTRKKFRPPKIRILFVGESTPAGGGFFYRSDNMTKYMKQAFEQVLDKSFQSTNEFLDFFKAEGCFLDDLSYAPVDHLPPRGAERRSIVARCVPAFANRMIEYQPEHVIAVLKSIEAPVRRAAQIAKLEVPVHAVPFPGNGHQNRFVVQLSDILRAIYKPPDRNRPARRSTSTQREPAKSRFLDNPARQPKMIKTLRFRNVDVSNVGRFDSEQSIYFPDGLTLVEEGNGGRGAAPIIEALHREYENASGLGFQEGMGEFPSMLIFFEGFTTYDINAVAPWGPLAALMQTDGELFSKRSDFESELEKNLRQLLTPKIFRLSSKFSVTLNERGAVLVTGSGGESLSVCFESSEEKAALYLAINAALRKVLSLDVPFVVDSRLRDLDRWRFNIGYQFIVEMSKQVIIFGRFGEGLGLRPNFRIVDDLINKSTIEKVT